MATAKRVVYNKRSKSNLFSSKNTEILSAQDGIEFPEQTEMESTLLMHGEANPQRVFEIDLHGSKLTKMEHFEKFSKLRCLDLSCNQIRNITGLQKNVELKELKLYSNKIKNLGGLDNLKELCSLQLQYNCICQLGTGLRNLKKLKSLRMDCNGIVNISVSEVAACSKLTFLNVSSNDLGDISFINCLPNLEEFYASNNSLVKIPDLGRCKKLQELDLSNNKISSIAGIKSLPSLTIVRLEHNDIRNLDISGAVTTLEQLYVGNNKLAGVKKIPQQFPALEVLDISSNIFNNLKEICNDLSACGNIKELNIANNPCFNGLSLDHQNCLKALPRLEVLNSNPVKRPQSSQSKVRPPMRPVSASQLVSTKHLEEQVSAAIQEQSSFESLIATKFDVVYDLLKKLPEKSSEESNLYKSNDKSFISKPEDQGYYFKHADSRSNSRPGTQESQQRNSSPRTTSDGSRPPSRCSNRARLHEAMTFAEQHVDE
ncbi:leucine-rich repeat-containing protein 9-like [Dendronephthya gigantea]|uniref:leucine-rich repeat-containing protein 9-like n=1 Tax=Dendronephthya gigantea TaxID=151771 RepID=UPI001069A461|nr:leucine-rich repeat-containing protein 9-like [Dendronephthya gigantea]